MSGPGPPGDPGGASDHSTTTGKNLDEHHNELVQKSPKTISSHQHGVGKANQPNAQATPAPHTNEQDLGKGTRHSGAEPASSQQSHPTSHQKLGQGRAPPPASVEGTPHDGTSNQQELNGVTETEPPARVEPLSENGSNRQGEAGAISATAAAATSASQDNVSGNTSPSLNDHVTATDRNVQQRTELTTKLADQRMDSSNVVDQTLTNMDDTSDNERKTPESETDAEQDADGATGRHEVTTHPTQTVPKRGGRGPGRGRGSRGGRGPQPQSSSPNRPQPVVQEINATQQPHLASKGLRKGQSVQFTLENKHIAQGPVDKTVYDGYEFLPSKRGTSPKIKNPEIRTSPKPR